MCACSKSTANRFFTVVLILGLLFFFLSMLAAVVGSNFLSSASITIAHTYGYIILGVAALFCYLSILFFVFARRFFKISDEEE